MYSYNQSMPFYQKGNIVRQTICTLFKRVECDSERITIVATKTYK